MQPGSKLLRLLVEVIRPTSFNGGEGLLPGRRVWLEASWGGQATSSSRTLIINRPANPPGLPCLIDMNELIPTYCQ